MPGEPSWNGHGFRSPWIERSSTMAISMLGTPSGAPVYFYVPPSIFSDIPKNETQFLDWEERGDYHGVASWVVLTYLRLRQAHYPVQFIQTLPEHGIVITHARVLRDQPAEIPPEVMLVCIEGDRGRSSSAFFHLVQNPVQEWRSAPWRRFYVPYWTQPGLVPRERGRDDRFETIGFFGNTFNLAPELRGEDWRDALNRMGLCWEPRLSHEDWYDYSGVDGVIAIRSFHRHWNGAWKPANKLFNAWSAGAIPIIGRESAMLYHAAHRVDCMVCNSVDQLLACLDELRESKDLRRALRANGAERAAEFQRDEIVKLWVDVIDSVLVPTFQGLHGRGVLWSLRRLESGATYLVDWGDRYRRYFTGKIAAKLRGEEFRGYV